MKHYISRSLRRVKLRTPGGKLKVVYKKRKPAKAKCGSCGSILHGVPNERPYKMMTMPKTQKRPERAYGGTLCSRCARIRIVEGVRK